VLPPRLVFALPMTADSLALDFKSATLYAVRVVLHRADVGDLLAALQKRMHDAGSFFENEPVVIDASRVEDAIDWTRLLEALREYRLPPIGVVATGENLAAAQRAGLTPVEISIPAARPAQNNAAVAADNSDAPVPSVPAAAVAEAPSPTDTGSTAVVTAVGAPDGDAAAPGVAASGEVTAHDNGELDGATAASGNDSTPAADNGAGSRQPRLAREAQPAGDAGRPNARPPQSSSALVITKPLRSGQRVYARHTDLIVIGMVSRGAEVIADGNVHVYGPLRGKAMAGARGDTSARIFTTELDAELLAVAGVYRVVEDKFDASLHNHPALIRLDGDTLRIEGLKA